MKLLETYILEAIREAKLGVEESKIPLADGMRLARKIVNELGLVWVDPRTIDSHTLFEHGRGYPVGSIRREKPDIGDIDIIVTSLIKTSDVAKVENVSGTYGGNKQVNFVYHDPEIGSRKVNLYVFLDPDTFGAALLHATGPQSYNVRLRNVAKHRGMKLSQNGLFDTSGNVVAGPSEASVQTALRVSNREANER